jgi:hypothetical protein
MFNKFFMKGINYKINIIYSMFEKIQHPKTGKWHKTSSAIGSQLIKNYSKKLKLTGGAMDLEPGQELWYYITMIKNELNSLREHIYPHVPANHHRVSMVELARAPSMHQITHDLRLVDRELRRITAQDGVFSVEMNNPSEPLTEALRDINNSFREISQQRDAADAYYNPPTNVREDGGGAEM